MWMKTYEQVDFALTDSLVRSSYDLRKKKLKKKPACLDFSSGSVMQNVPLNPIDTGLNFELKTLS